jgi:hypothetical protein
VRRVFAVLALLFFCLPVGLRAAGITARPFENRKLAGPPGLSDGWDAFDHTTRFFVDRLPLREQAVKANTWLSLHVWDTLPDYARTRNGGDAALPFGAPQAETPPGTGGATTVRPQPGVTVLRGHDGWLYLGEELTRACEQSVPWPLAMRRFERLVSIVRASGRKVVFVIPPDKSTIYPEHLPDDYAGKDCAAAGRARTWATIEGTNRPEIIGLRRLMLETKAASPDPLYWSNDTHWNTRGAVLALRAAFEQLGGPIQVDDADIRRERRPNQGDLPGLIGLRQEVDGPAWSIERAVGQATESTKTLRSGRPATFVRRAPGSARTILGRTLFVNDSFGQVMLPALEQYTNDLETFSWFSSKPDDIVDAVARADTVIFEKVERDAYTLAGEGGWVTPAFLDRLEARLQQSS